MKVKIKPIDYLMQQYNTLESMYKGTLILESIKPSHSETCFTFLNNVPKTAERSPISQKYFNSSKQYLAFFKSRSYHFLFNDYSLGRFYYEFDSQNKLISYNLLWFPCPFTIEYLKEYSDLADDNMETVFEFLDNIQETDNFQYENFSLRTPIRIDFDACYSGNKSNFHPSSHIHFQNTDTRANNVKVFCLYKYFAFIVENCYPYINFDHHENDKNINKRMLSESLQWLKCKSINEADYGSKIYTSYSF